MNTTQHKTSRPSIWLNILLVIMLGVIAALIYILAGGEIPRAVRNIGVESPNAVTQPIAQPRDTIFSDGLGVASDTQIGNTDEFGIGIARRDIYTHDINNDGRPDRITRTHHETGNAHSYDEYTIELNHNGTMMDITPDNMRTTQGAECALAKIQFTFKPDFRITKISRPWQDSWSTPTMAVKTVYALDGNGQLRQISHNSIRVVCDVSTLF